jgi:hypothetical protein
MSRGEWQFVVGWTINLHGNCGPFIRPEQWGAAEAFADEFERRLQGPVDLSTIDWIWDEYCLFSKYGQAYSDKYRPTRPETFRGAKEGCFGFHVD